MRALPFVLAAVGLLATVGSTAAQQQPPGPPQEDTTQLVFEREVFDYPDFERRNPFVPLLTTTGGGPRFEQVQLLGIIHSADPSRSVSLLALEGMGGPGGGGEGAPAEPGRCQQACRLRVGESWGNFTVIAIEPSRVIFEVEEFGLTEQRELRLSRVRGQGGGQ